MREFDRVVEHNGYTFIQSKFYVPIDGGYSFAILDERMRVVKQSATKNPLTTHEAEWMIDNVRMERT